MKYKFNPLTGEFNLVPDSGTLKQKLNWLTGNFNLTKDAGKYKQIYNVIEGEFNLYPATTQVVIHGVGSIQLTNAVENGLLSLKAYGGTEQSNLPKGYTQLEYINMLAGSLIKVEDLPINSGYKVEYDFQTTTLSTELRNYIGGRAAGVSAGGGFRLSKLAVSSTYNHNVVLYCFESGAEYYAPEQFQPNTRYKFTYDDGVCTLESGGSVISTKTFTITDNTSTNWGINAYVNGSSWQTNSENVYVYSLKVWNDQDELVMDLVPAKTSTEIGLYDMVTGTLRTATVGTFEAGPNAVPTPTAPMDIISNNGVLKVRHQSGLPTGYTLLDYIQSGGSNYIDTGIKITNEDVIEMQYLQTVDKGAIYGEYYNGTANMSTTLYGNGTFYFYGFNAGGNATSVGNYDTNVHTVVHNFVDGYIDFDGVRTNFDLPNPNSFTNTLNCPIFGRSNGSSIGYFSKTQLYYFRIRRNGTLILDLIPAKDSNNNVGMYDRISGTLFTESGSGSFVAGDTVSDPIEVYTDGVVETINAHSKNLFDKNSSLTNGYINSSGAIVSGVLLKVSPFIEIKPNTTYTISGTGDVKVLSYDRYAYTYTAEQTPIAQVPSQSGGASITFTTAPNAKYIRIQITYDAVSTCQLELGSTATEYTPYFDGGTATAEMLLKIGDYADEQEILSGNITRKVGVKVFDGTESWAYGGNSSGQGFYLSVSDAKLGAFPISTHFNKATTYGYGIPDKTISRFSATSQSIIIKYSDMISGDSVSLFKQYLADQYNAGTPVIVVYPLAEEITETVTGQTMNIPKGDSTIEIVQASLDNLELEVTYEQEA